MPSSSSPIHPASQVSPSLHSSALIQLVDLKISRSVIEYVIDCVADTVDFALGRPSSSSSPGRTKTANQYPSFTTFVTNVLTRAEVTMPTLLASLAYIDRIKPHLNIALEQWALERVFLGALIVASKVICFSLLLFGMTVALILLVLLIQYLNDSTLKNVHWALCTGVFGKRDVGRIEREFLDVLDFELSVTEDALLSHHDGLTAAVLPSSRRSHAPYDISHHHHHHHQRTHHHHHRSPKSAVPELRPSSPESSISSFSPSPRTPSSLSISPMDHAAHPLVPVKFSQPSIFSATTLDLLRAFPIPVSSTASSHPPPQEFHPRSSHLQYPVHIVS